jgi:predicted PhzF superfamily epimerase YddE/YHI9
LNAGFSQRICGFARHSCRRPKKLLGFFAERQTDSPENEKAAAPVIDYELQSSTFYAFAGEPRYAFAGELRQDPPGAGGNPCQVTLLSRPAQSAPTPDRYTHCLSWQTGDDQCAVRCWTAAGNSIAVCGHGLLCTAMAWLERDQGLSQFDMNGLRVMFHADEQRAWVGLPPIHCRASRVPHWISEVFPSPPWRAAEAGDDNAYLVLEWPAGFDLSTLPVPPYALRRRTGRALIVTAAEHPGSRFDIQFRYFAPQHGVPEDTATGSAMRVLAHYWMNRELSDQLHAYQCSPRGGELRSRIRGDLTWVGGRVLRAGAGVDDVD